MRKLTLARRLSLIVMGVLVVMSAVIMAVVFSITRRTMVAETESRYEGIVMLTNEKIRGVMSDVYVAAVNNLNVIERDIDSADRLREHLERMVGLNQYMSSCRLVFEPGYGPAGGRRQEIYAWRDAAGTVRSRLMDEGHPDFLVHDWYREAFEKEEGDWTPPYFDRAASRQLTTTYMTHVHDRHGRRVGMLGADVSLEWLRRRHQRLDRENHEHFERGFSQQSYSFIIDKDGTYLIHPDQGKVLKRRFQDVAAESPDTLDDNMAVRMLNGESGIERIIDGKIDAWVFYSYIKYTEWTVVIIVPDEIIYHNGNVLASVLLTVFAVGLVVIYFLCNHFLRANMKPLKRFVTAADQVARGRFDVELPVVKSREVDALRTAFKGMQTSLRQYVDELKDTTASKAAMEQELKIASNIQMQMLPKDYPPFPDRTDIDIYGEVVTAKEVGGDLFDFFIRDEKLFFSIGDVAGKGVPASLVMAVARSIFRSASMTHTSPKLIVESINRSVCQSNDSYMFVTLFMGVLDLQTGSMQYCNAGHEPPVLVGSHTRFLPIENNIPLGLRPEWEYKEQEVKILPGTTVFLYTDGFTEAETVDHKQYGRDRMFKEVMLLAARRLDSRTLVKNIRQTERTFVGFIPQMDDISLLAIKYVGNLENVRYHRSILLSNDVQEIPILTIFIDGICQDMQFDEMTTAGVNLAIEEAVVNVMKYGYAEGVRGDILLETTSDDECVYFVLRDSGTPFDPTKAPEVDVDSYVQKRSVGGLGIHLIRHYMDDIAYEYTDSQNVLRMTKKLDRKESKKVRTNKII